MDIGFCDSKAGDDELSRIVTGLYGLRTRVHALYFFSNTSFPFGDDEMVELENGKLEPRTSWLELGRGTAIHDDLLKILGEWKPGPRDC